MVAGAEVKWSPRSIRPLKTNCLGRGELQTAARRPTLSAVQD